MVVVVVVVLEGGSLVKGRIRRREGAGCWSY
jgi:hypothetical protein